MKKLFCILTVITLLFCILAPVTTSAQSTPILPENTPLFLESAIKGGLMEYTDDVALKLEIYDRLYSALINLKTSVEVFDLSIDYKDKQIFNNCINYIINNNPILYYTLNPRFGYQKVSFDSGETWYIHTFILDYSDYDSNVLEDEISTTKKLVSDIAKKVPKNLSDIAKMLWVHDYLAVNYKYDETYQIHSAYGFLTQKTGVCSSYAHTFTAIMTELGIPATSAYHVDLRGIPNESNNHQWNIVLLDGKYYHIDCTWGDPTPDSYGTAYHNFFLLSDNQLEIADPEEAGAHSNYYTLEKDFWGLNISCTDTKYDSGYVWSTSKNGFIYYNGEFYYICNTTTNELIPTATIYKTTDFKTTQFVTNFTSQLWSFNENGANYYHNNFFYTGFEIIGSQLYFNNAHSIQYYDLENGQDGIVLEKEDNIFSFHYLGKGKFSYTTHDQSHKNVENTLTITDKGHIYDSTSDSYNLDLIAMRKYLLGNHDDNICLVKGDLSGDDSVVNILDFVALKKLAAQ